MKTLNMFFMNAWRWKCNLPPLDYKINYMLDLDTLIDLQWDSTFENTCRDMAVFWDVQFIEFCRRLMVQGAFRYGTLEDNKRKDAMVTLNNLEYRLQRFWLTKDLTLLCDIANFAFIAFYNFRYQGYKATPMIMVKPRATSIKDASFKVIKSCLKKFKRARNLTMLCIIFNFCMWLFIKLRSTSGYSFVRVETKKVEWY